VAVMYNWKIVAKLMKMDGYTNSAIYKTLRVLAIYNIIGDSRISLSSIKRSFHIHTPLPVGFDLWWKARTRQGSKDYVIPFPLFPKWYGEQMKQQLYTSMWFLSVEGQNEALSQYIDEGTFYQAGESQDNQPYPLWELGDTNLKDSFIYYPTVKTRDGIRTYLRREYNENKRMDVLPRWDG
jgi:hypothetical protein